MTGIIRKKIGTNAWETVEDTGNGGSLPAESWEPAHFVGTWGVGTTYAFGDAVRADDAGTWKLYISLVDANVGNDPVGDAINWQDVVAAARPVVVEGTANPFVVGEQSRITHYTQDATGGTFDLGTAAGIAWDALEATTQAALDSAYGAGKTQVAGDAADFAVTYYFDDLASLDFDGTNLTGGGLTLQDDTQDQIVGGFVASVGSLYLSFTEDESVYWFAGPGGVWTQSNTLSLSSASGKNLVAGTLLSRSGSGGGDGTQGNATILNSVNRFGTGDGNVTLQQEAFRWGSGIGNATADNIAEVNDTAVGEASATMTADHHTGGRVTVGGFSDDTGRFVRLGDPSAMGNSGKGFKVGDCELTTAVVADDVIANYNTLRAALIAAGFATDGD